MLRFGVDLGGTKIEIVALDDLGAELYRKRVATPQGDYQSTLNAIAELITSAEQQLTARGSVGIGTPGAISRATGRLKNSNSVCLNGQPLVQDLTILLDRSVRLSNDANCFALSEATDGAAAGADVVFGVIVGTGTGAGIVVRGHVLEGPNSIAGEWGHNPLPWPNDSERPGAACYCGRQGCIETFLSGPGITRDHEQVTGTRSDAQQIASCAAQGDVACEATLQRYEDRMARALAHVINILDPHVIVLGGGLGNIARLYENIPRLWGKYVFSDRVDTRLVAPKFGAASGVRGAAWLWNDGM